MAYRVDLAQNQDRDLDRAAALQSKLIDWDRHQAAAALGLSGTAPLDAGQRNAIRSLAVSLEALGHIRRKQGSANCVALYQETIGHDRRIGDSPAEAITHYNLGDAYLTLPAIRDLDAAEAAYRRSLDLRDPQDALGRSRCIQQIDVVHHARFNESYGRGESEAVVLGYAQAAERHYRQALDLCPAAAIADRGPIHGQLGSLYDAVGRTDDARQHFEHAAHCFEQTSDRHKAGGTRFNLALMYGQAAERESAAPRRRDLLHRAQAYAQAALRDFSHYQGRAADLEARAQRLIDAIGQALAAPPS